MQYETKYYQKVTMRSPMLTLLNMSKGKRAPEKSHNNYNLLIILYKRTNKNLLWSGEKVALQYNIK